MIGLKKCQCLMQVIVCDVLCSFVPRYAAKLYKHTENVLAQNAYNVYGGRGGEAVSVNSIVVKLQFRGTRGD